MPKYDSERPRSEAQRQHEEGIRAKMSGQDAGGWYSPPGTRAHVRPANDQTSEDKNQANNK